MTIRLWSKLTDEFLRLCLVKSHFAYCRHRTTEKRDSWADELHEVGKMAAGSQEYEYESTMRGPTTAPRETGDICVLLQFSGFKVRCVTNSPCTSVYFQGETVDDLTA